MTDKPAKADEEATKELPGEDSAPVPPPPRSREAMAPEMASCLTGLCLLIIAVATTIWFWWNENVIFPEWWHFVLIGLLVVIIPIIIYRALTLWLMGERSRYPDIDTAWRAGVAALNQQGMSLRSAPIFLIVGAVSSQQRRNFMRASNFGFAVEGVPRGETALKWYANRTGIFLVFNNASWLDSVTATYRVQPGAKSRPRLPSDQPSQPAPAAKRQAHTETVDFGREPTADDSMDADPISRGQNAASPRRNAPRHFKRTVDADDLLPDSVEDSDSSDAPGPAPPQRGAAEDRRSRARHSSQESSQLLRELQYVCGLLRRARHPLCPINGMLVLIPFRALQASHHNVSELERAIAADVATITRETQLRFPVTAVIVGMEQEDGFREMVRRVGPDSAAHDRFGQRFDLRALATPEELKNFASHVCGKFEDCVYTLFRDEDALQKANNELLYEMLCKVRRGVRSRLGDVLATGFGYDSNAYESPFLFSGCYFAATGAKRDRQAFVHGILSKLFDEQEEIEWTEDALVDDRRRRRWTLAGWIVSGCLALAIACWLVYQRWNS